MLQQLTIQNYALIDSLKIDFKEGLNIITGETGAGKSILIGALSLILGERADSSVIQQKDKKCFIEGVFKTNHSSVIKYLKDNDPDNYRDDQADEIVIRREVSPNGKSRAFINDTPVNLNQLKTFASFIVNLHQQFDTLELGDNDFQREVIDELSGNPKDITQYKTQYKNYSLTLKELERLKEEEASANKELDYNKFLFDELEESNFSENEIENIEAEIKLMSNAENIKSILSEIYFQLQESDQPLVQQIKLMINKLQGLRDFHKDLETLATRLHSAQIELQDIAGEIGHINNGINYDAKK